ncbi:MAG: TraB/GumN family protein [Sphaerochaetaceae bacterium]|nr:TraB/GumN family protein [Sphaerochaetaceae bacterium]
MNVEKISDTVHRLTLEDQEIVLVGTAHISQNSVEEVSTLIDSENPDRVCVELDDGRMKSKTQKKSWEEKDIRTVFREGKGFLLLANTALASFQRRMGLQTGTKPGEEILGAAEKAKEKNIPVSLCDREIQTTFRRAWAKSNLWNKCKLLATLITAAFSKEEITPEELEELKKQDTLQSMMDELSKELPSVKEVLIDERDCYLGRSIFEAPGKKKIAVIGAGHTQGVISTIGKLDKGEKTPSLEELTVIPSGGWLSGAMQFIVPTLLILIIFASAFNSGWDQGLRAFIYWGIVNASCTFIATLISGAHILNIIACTVTAPLFALAPVLGVGMLGGILEATFKKPKVKDFEAINDDSMTLKGWYRNRILHALLVFFLSSLGSVFGTLVAFPFLLTMI